MRNEPITSFDEYLAASTPGARRVLRRIRAIVRQEAPQAQEVISFRMPAFRQGQVFIYFAAFKTHIGIYPPMKAGGPLEKALRPYRGPKGNLKFPLDQTIPYPLIWRVAQALQRQYTK